MNNTILQLQVKAQQKMLMTATNEGEARAMKFSWRMGTLAGVLGAPTVALAAKNTCGVNQNSVTAADSLVGLVNQAANFLMYIGVAVAVFMIAYGGFRILSAAKSSWARDGMGYVKNAVIGLVIMLSGLFLKGIVIAFLEGGTGTASQDCDPFA